MSIPGNNNYIISGGGAQQSQGNENIIVTTAGYVALETITKIANAPPTGTTIYDAINYISSMLSRHLLRKRSDLLATSELNISITSSATSYVLPTDFLALNEKPFLTTSPVQELDVLSKRRSEWYGITYTRPEEFNIAGTLIELFPAFTQSDTLIARYFAIPQPVAAPDDVIPFGGVFDNIYLQGVPRVVVKGLAVIQSDQDFAIFIGSEVDTVLDARVSLLPDKRMKRSNWT